MSNFSLWYLQLISFSVVPGIFLQLKAFSLIRLEGSKNRGCCKALWDKYVILSFIIKLTYLEWMYIIIHIKAALRIKLITSFSFGVGMEKSIGDSCICLIDAIKCPFSTISFSNFITYVEYYSNPSSWLLCILKLIWPKKLWSMIIKP